jgi:hypothetical protein
MEIRVLGPLELVGEDGRVALSPMPRRLLAALVSRSGETCSADWLLEALWGEGAPASAAKLLQVYVSQLRKALPSPVRIGTRGGGYVLELREGAVDAARFERLLGEARGAMADANPALASSLLRRALALWARQRLRRVRLRGVLPRRGRTARGAPPRLPRGTARGRARARPSRRGAPGAATPRSGAAAAGAATRARDARPLPLRPANRGARALRHPPRPPPRPARARAGTPAARAATQDPSTRPHAGRTGDSPAAGADAAGATEPNARP